MVLRKIDKIVLVNCPLFFGLVLLLTAIMISRHQAGTIHELIMISSGLICVSIYCISSLLVRLIQK